MPFVSNFFHRAIRDKDMCESSQVFFSITIEMVATCVDLHGFRGLYVLRLGGLSERVCLL